MGREEPTDNAAFKWLHEALGYYSEANALDHAEDQTTQYAQNRAFLHRIYHESQKGTLSDSDMLRLQHAYTMAREKGREDLMLDVEAEYMRICEARPKPSRTSLPFNVPEL